MKKITLLLVTLFFSMLGYAQFTPTVEGFESTTGPTPLPSTTWSLSTGNWAVFDNGIGLNQRWGINSTVVAPPTPPLVYQGANSAYVNRENIGQGNTSEDYLASPLVNIPINGQLRFYTRTFTTGNQGTVYQIKVAPSSASQTNPAAYTLVQQWTEVDLTVAYNIYEEKLVDLSAYAGQQVYISFVKVYTQPGTTLDGDRWLVDNVSVQERCLDPINLTASGITQTSANLSWGNPSGATSWEIEVLPLASPFTGVGIVYNGILPYTATTTATGTPLAPSTDYKYYVRALCSNGANSLWVGPFNFSTSSPGFTCTAPIVIGSIPFSTTDNTGNYGDTTDVAQPAACAGTATNYMTGNDVFYSYTPTANGAISVTMTPGATWSGIFVYQGCPNVGVSCIAGVANTGNAPRVIPSIAVTAGLEYIIVISTNAAPQTLGYTLVIQQVNCAEPTTLSVSGLTQTSANLSWANPGGATSWEVAVQPAGSPIPSGSGVQTNINTNYPVTSLTVNTAYQYYVRADCNNGTFSAWAGPFLFNTLCDPFPVPFQEGFNTGSPTENCWTVLNSNGDGDTWNMNYATNPFEGDQCSAITTDFNNGLNDDWLISPQIILNGNQRLKFHYRVQSTGEPNDFRVMLSTNGTSPTDFTTTLIPLASYSNTTYVQRIQTLAGISGPVNIAWHVPAAGLDGWRLYIDNVIIEDIPTCPEPTLVASSNVLSTSATVTWTNGGSETAWQVLALPCGSPAPNASATGFVDVTTGSPYNLTGLTPTTCYDVYVRAVCSPTDISPWTGPATFTTQVAPPVCGGTFTDPGGPTADYAGNTDSTVTICPINPGDVVTVTFNSFETETNWDALYVFDGNSITAPQIASTNGAGNVPGGLAGGYWGTAIPGPFTSSSVDGCLTFRFRSDGSVQDPGWVANVTCGPPPTCRRPTAVTTSTVTSNSVILNWTQPTNPDNSVASAWQVLALPCGSPAPAANATGFVDVTSGPPYTLTGLNSSTCYDIYIRAVCSPTDSSIWSGPSTITTQVAPPVCGGTFVDAGGPANYPNNSDSTVTVCPVNPGDVVTVTFTSFSTENNFDALYVFDGNSIAAPQIASTNGAGNVPGGLAGGYWGTAIPGPFTSSSPDGCLTFRFRSDGVVNLAGWVADVTCNPAPECPKPNTLTATSITTTSAFLGWNEQNPAVVQWEVIILPLGSPVPLPSATGTIVSTNPALFTGLTPGTQYTFYVRSICPTSGTSLWSNGFNFNTLLANDECSGATFAPVNSSAVCQQVTPGSIAGATASASPAIAPCIGNADDDVWFQFIATNQYLNLALQNITGTTTNLNFAVYSGQCGTLNQIFCSAANSVSGVLNNLTVGNTYYVRVYSNAATPQSTTFNLCISTPSTCPTASTVCYLENYANTTGVTSLGTIGCLFTSPNPAYFTIQVATTGPINFLLTQSTTPGGAPNIDVDYAAWGPFTSQEAACTFIGTAQPFAPPGIGVPVTQQTGCSYSAAPTEILNITNAVAGQFYIVLITNFSNQAGYINLTQSNINTPGAGTTNCCPDAYFTYSPVTYCIEPGAPNPIPVITSGSVAGVFSSTLTPGLVFVDTATGEINLQASLPGNYVVTNTVAPTATCGEKVKSFTISLVAPTTATIAYDSASYCESNTTLQNVIFTGATGGSFSASPNGGLYIDANTGAINPSLSAPGIYTVTYALPGAGVCVGSNPTATVEIIQAPVPTFDQVAPICPGDLLADLPTTSTGAVAGITGTWSPAMNNTQTTTYTFTPDAGQCASIATMTINVGSTTPTFNQVNPICPGEPLADLPTTSLNGVVGVWTPAMDNTQTTTYTFTPTTGNCVSTVTMTIQVLTPTIVPTFNDVAPICPGDSLAALPTTSTNGITGSWSPALDNTQTATYTFTPDTGQCALTTTLTITVNPRSEVTVNSPSFCPGSTATVTATPTIPGAYDYVWTVPAGATDPGNVASFVTSVPGTYTVVITPVNTFCNSDFETPVATGSFPNLVNENLVPCWDTTSADGIIEIWPPGFESVTPYSGNNLIELNANTPGTLFQDFSVIPGTTISVSFAHRGRNGVDVVGVEVGPVGGPYVSLGNFADGNTAWALHTVNYTIPTGGGSNYTLRFVSVSSTGGSPSIGNLLDAISISSLGCASLPTSGEVSIQFLPAPDYTVTQTTCTVQTGTIEVNAPTGANYEYTIDGTNYQSGTTFANLAPGTYNLTVHDLTSGCFSNAVEIVINPVPVTPTVLEFSYTTPICQNAAASMSPVLAPGFTPNGTFTFQPSTGLNIDPATGVITLGTGNAASIPGTYTVTYTVLPDNTTCLVGGSFDFEVVINPIITPVTTIAYDALYCSGGVNPLPDTSAPGFTSGGTYSATSGLLINSTTGLIDLSSPAGTYTVTYTVGADASTCRVASSSTAQVVISSPVQISVEGNCEGVQFVLTVSPVEGAFDSSVTFAWENSAGTNVGNTQSIVVTSLDTYTVTVTSNGCPNTSTIIVDAIACVIQRGISANNDGLNDFFDLRGFNVKNLSIFNRYGMKVYTKADYTDQWKGQSDDGDELPDGTYYFVIERENGETRTGWIYINRAQ